MTKKRNVKNIVGGSVIALGMIGTYTSVDAIKEGVSSAIENSRSNVLTIRLNTGENIPDLSGNPNGYTKITVVTTGDKTLDSTDFSRLKSSEIPRIDLSGASASSIPNNAFSRCTWLEEFIYPEGVTSIGDYAFNGCSGLTSNFAIPDSVTTIGEYTFQNCSGFTGNLVIPDSVTTIGEYAFLKCTGFNGKLVIGNSVKYIPEGIFSGCSNLTGDLIIPDSVTSIYSQTTDDYARPFYGCTKLKGNLVVGKGVELGDKNIFAGTSLSGDLIIGEGRTTIPENSFRDLVNFKGNLVIADSITSISTSAFRGCSGFRG